MTNKKQRSVFARLIGMQLVSVCISLLIIGVLFGYMLQKYYHGAREWNLIEQSNRMVRILQNDISEGDVITARERIYTLASSSDITLWIIGEDGHIIAGSHMEQEDDFLTLEQTEVAHVLAGNSLTKKVMGPNFQSLLVVQPLYDNLGTDADLSETIGALVMRAPLGDVGDTINNLMQLIVIAGLAAGIIVMLISMSMAKGFAKPLQQLKHATLDIAHSKYRKLSVPPHSSEVDLLIEAFNYASEQINLTSQEQQELEKLRKEFLSDLSHELRAPLTSLKGFLELMEKPLPPSEQERYRKIMLQDTLYLERLIGDVQELSKMESGHYNLVRSWMDPADLINHTISSLELQLAEKNVSVVTELAQNLPNLYIDSQRMHQVLLNLVINALQHSPTDGIITIRAYTNEEQIVVEVSDQGPGIPQEHRPYIFERFYKLDKARTRGYKGSGLGLAIAKEIIELHNGSVQVETTVGEGACFILTIPIAHD